MFEIFDFMEISAQDFSGDRKYEFKQNFIPKHFWNLNPSHDVELPFPQESWSDRLESITIGIWRFFSQDFPSSKDDGIDLEEIFKLFITFFEDIFPKASKSSRKFIDEGKG